MVESALELRGWAYVSVVEMLLRWAMLEVVRMAVWVEVRGCASQLLLLLLYGHSTLVWLLHEVVMRLLLLL